MLLRFRDWDMRAGHIVYTEETDLVVYVCTGSGFPLTDEKPSTEEHHEASAEQVIEYARSVDLFHQTNAVDGRDLLHHNV
jgi:hypothetical protein